MLRLQPQPEVPGCGLLHHRHLRPELHRGIGSDHPFRALRRQIAPSGGTHRIGPPRWPTRAGAWYPLSPKMRRAQKIPVILLFWVSWVAAGGAEEKEAPPFRLGTFEHQGRTFVGQVRGDQAVIDIAAANAALEKSHPAWPKVKPPEDMNDLIARYEAGGLKARLHAISRETGAARAPYVHEMKAVRIRPPILYPETMLNAAVNYTEHDAEMAGRPAAPAPPPANPPRTAPGLWERRP